MNMTSDVILSGIVGSTAYGLARENSDTDRLGCFMAPSSLFLGLHPPTGRAASRVSTQPDVTEHELGKYVSLLLACNPTVTELLWLPDGLYEVRRPVGEDLVALRSKFLSARAVRNAYLGYATQQFRKLCERGDGSFSSDTRQRTQKHARHLRRLCVQGWTLYSTGHLPIRVEDPDEYFAFGESVAQDPSTARDFISRYEDRFAESPGVLPEHPSADAIDEWLIETRKAAL